MLSVMQRDEVVRHAVRYALDDIGPERVIREWCNHRDSRTQLVSHVWGSCHALMRRYYQGKGPYDKATKFEVSAALAQVLDFYYGIVWDAHDAHD